MEVSQVERGSASRSFVTTAYREDAAGELVPDLPVEGPCREGSTSACRVCLHHWRKRETGSARWLAVGRCRQHGVAFTLYPPGHVPYGREALVRLAPDGGAVRVEQGGDELEGTLAAAARDASQGKRWPPIGARSGDGGVRSTQGRRLRWLGTLTGVSPQMSARGREAAARSLGLPATLLCEHSAAIASRVRERWRRWGEAIRSVLEELWRAELDPLARLLATGYEAGLWGRPYVWQGSQRGLRSLVAAFR